jgi:hypothetical protein
MAGKASATFSRQPESIRPGSLSSQKYDVICGYDRQKPFFTQLTIIY